MIGTAGLPPTVKHQSGTHPLSPTAQSKRCATISGIRLEVIHDAALCSDPDVVSNLQMLRHAHLSANVHVVAQRCTAGNARLRCDDAARSKLHVVTNLDLISCTQAIVRRPN